MTTRHCDVLVLGGGPGGYAAAIRAGRLGLDTVLVEADACGGTCLNRGCIPSKAFIHAGLRLRELNAHTSGTGVLGITLENKPALDCKAMVDWKDGIVRQLNGGVDALLKNSHVDVIKGWGRFQDGKTVTVETPDGDRTVVAKNVVIATGSTATEIPTLPFGGAIMSSTEALDIREIPKNLVVVGAGYIGIELGIAFHNLGSNVTFVEAGERILPGFDQEMTAPVERWLKGEKIKVLTQSTAKSVKHGKKISSLVVTDEKGSEQTLKAEKILVTVGRRPNTGNWGLENLAVDMDGPFIKVDNRLRTSMNGVWAIGDVVGEPMLAHKATAQGECVAEIIAGHKREFNPQVIPAVCFSEPELVAVGRDPDQAKTEGIDIKTAKFPFDANGRALTATPEKGRGFVRITARASDHAVIGVHAVGAHISELSGAFALAIEMGARLEDITGTIHAHPTLSEAFPEAAAAALGQPLHMMMTK